MIAPLRWLRTAEFLARTRLEFYRHRPALRRLQEGLQRHVPKGQGENPVLVFNASTRTWGISLNAAFSLLISWGLRLGGVPVRYLVCTAGMEQCMLGTVRTKPHAAPPCVTCTRLSRQMFPAELTERIDAPPAGWQQYPDFEQYQTLRSLIDFTYEGLDLGRICLPSLRWVLRRHHLPDTEQVRSLFRRYMRAALHVADTFSSLLDRIHPRAVLVFNGITFPEAVVRQLALDKGIPVVTHEVGVQPYSVFLTYGEATAYPIDIDERFQLEPEEDERLNAYLSKRFQGDFTMAGIRFWPEMKGLDSDLQSRMGQFKETVAVFSNVIFDTSQVHANVVFADMFDWLEQVVEYARQRQSTLFVIRAHPDELRPGKEAQETVEDAVRANGALELDNIVFIGPRAFLSSYDLIRNSKLVLVYNSSIGLEATLLGRVVLCGGASRYSRYPTVYLPEDPQSYFQLADQFLEQEAPRPPETFITEARRFYYVQHFLTSLDFSAFLRPHATFPGYVEFSDFDPLDLHPHRCIESEVIRRGILDGGSFFYDRPEVGLRHPGERGQSNLAQDEVING